MKKIVMRIGVSLIVMIAMTFSAIPTLSFAQTGESGQTNMVPDQPFNSNFIKPYEPVTVIPDGYIGITTKEELNNIRFALSGQYILMNDIVFQDSDFALGGAFYNNGMGWDPFGEFGAYDYFSGTLDGNGYTIYGLKQNLVYQTSGGYFELGGLIDHNRGTVINLGLASVNMSGKVLSSAAMKLGGIAGWNDGIISNCYVSGQIVVPDQASSAGGIAGYNTAVISFSRNLCAVSSYSTTGGVTCTNEGTISDCVNEGTVTTTNTSGMAGGIASENYATVMNCYNTGLVKATFVAGGIVGSNNDILHDCFNTGRVETTAASSRVAGIAAYNGDTLSSCYSDGKIYNTGSSPLIGGVVSYGAGTVTKSYYNSAYGTAKYGTPLSDAQLKTQSSFVGFDFSTIWVMNADICRPVLASMIPETFAITYNPSGGTMPVGTPGKYMAGSNNKLAVPVKAGNAFLGWYETGTSSATGIFYVPEGSKRALNLTAKWGPPITSAISYNYNSARVFWAYAGGATTYKIYRATSTAGPYSLVYTATSTARSYVNTGLVTGKTYYYKVYPVVGTTAYGNTTYKAVRPIPSTPATTVTKYSTTSIKVTWTGVSGATKYQVYRATSLTGTYSLVYTASSTLRSWVNTSRTRGVTYYYKVRAYHLEGSTYVYGAFSAVKSLKL